MRDQQRSPFLQINSPQQWPMPEQAKSEVSPVAAGWAYPSTWPVSQTCLVSQHVLISSHVKQMHL